MISHHKLLILNKYHHIVQVLYITITSSMETSYAMGSIIQGENQITSIDFHAEGKIS